MENVEKDSVEKKLWVRGLATWAEVAACNSGT